MHTCRTNNINNFKFPALLFHFLSCLFSISFSLFLSLFFPSLFLFLPLSRSHTNSFSLSLTLSSPHSNSHTDHLYLSHCLGVFSAYVSYLHANATTPIPFGITEQFINPIIVMGWIWMNVCALCVRMVYL